MIKILNAALAIVAGVGGMLALFWILNLLVERLPGRWEERIKPYVFIGPAIAIVGLFLVYPAVQTVIFSFADKNSQKWVGFENYTALWDDENFRAALVNNLLWILVVPAASVLVGLLIAVLADRLRPGNEKIAKSVIFMPMAISFVGASTIWRFIYDTRFAEGDEQIGLLSAITTGLGFDPVAWLRLDSWNVNDFLLMVIMIWLQAGFAMVLLSAAVKGVPDDTLEAARIDGANELQIFFRVVVPQIWPTVIVVFTTVLILVMKVFDIVYVMTGGNADTDVVANIFVEEMIEFGDDGRAAAVVVVLMIAVIPVMIYQVRRFRMQEAGR
ncbi:carbohydrate ABC transporter permease [Nocardioides bizhenqiangii]|uniref:Sugar ABC transporter permease n=1 Tax=Nocardioides bizhenqiangii TaxID=3095076 RepID=A0ABZ0ZN41_9ACTN|nr:MULTISPECIES: sugar ABC transporter permease [unclassified Nocardioides]MDZ5621364.1 sugar ABC transporter permease [Nocardioides sp. HM23]WQQ25796.1 sugar ABC transporter permease [Nocardioides sp. HM61]